MNRLAGRRLKGDAPTTRGRRAKKWLVGCGILLTLHASGVPAAEDADRQAVIDTMQAWEKAVETADYEALEDFYADDALYYPNNTAPIVGRAAIIARNRQRGSASMVDIEQRPDDVYVNGNWAVYSCLARIRLPGRDGANDNERFVRVLLLMEKGEDGRWRILRDIDNTTPETF
jgi:uncharacterized protein (TIGR02246 family)